MTTSKSTKTTEHPKEWQCTAKAKSTGNRCTRKAIRGGTVCPVHGGSSPNVKKAAQRRLTLQKAQADAASTLAHLGITPITDPITELGKVAREILALKDSLAARVNALDDITDTNSFGVENVRAVVDLYNTALDRSVRVLDSLGKHDLETRRVQIEERTAAMFQWILAGVLNDLNLTPHQQTRAPHLINEWVQKSLEGVEARELPQL